MNPEDSLDYWKRRCAENEKLVKALTDKVEDLQIENMGLGASNRTLESRLKMLEGRDG